MTTTQAVITRIEQRATGFVVSGGGPIYQLYAPESTPCDRAAYLGRMVGSVATTAHCYELLRRQDHTIVEPLRDDLEKTAAGALAWLVSLRHVNRDLAPLAIAGERDRQRLKFGANWYAEQPASVLAAVLLEEAGEVAQESLHVQLRTRPDREAHLGKELVQVAAVCVAWLEALEVANG